MGIFAKLRRNVDWQFVKLSCSFDNFKFSLSSKMKYLLSFGVKEGEKNCTTIDSLATDFKK